MCPNTDRNGFGSEVTVSEDAGIRGNPNINEGLSPIVNGPTSKNKATVQFTLVESVSCSILSDEEDSGIVYTIGYEGLTMEELIEKLKCHRIRQLIDVRERSASRKKGFSKIPLRQRLEEEGIAYVHMRTLGAPPEIRHEYKKGGSEKIFFERYEKHLNEEVSEEITAMEKHVSERTSVLMCFERSYLRCHRKILADKLKDMGYRVKHL